jgi:hypothetical protein
MGLYTEDTAMAVCKSSIFTLILAILSTSVVAWAADDEGLINSIVDKTPANYADGDDSTPDTYLSNIEEDYKRPCSERCSRRPCRRCSVDCCAGYSVCCDPQWTATAEALFLRPSATSGQQLLFDPLEGTSLLNSTDMGFSCTAAPRLSLIRHRQCGWDLELNYFGISASNACAEFPSSALPNGVGSLIVDNGIFLPVDAVGFEEHFRLYSGEFNLRRPINDWITTLVGFRWVEFFDNYQAQGIEAVGSTSFAHSINARNHMYGFQIGDEALLFQPSCRFRIKGFAKIGVFYNASDQNSNLFDPASFDNLSAVAGRSHAAFLGELGLMGTYQLTTHVALHGGYQVMWIEGVALAPRQIPLTNLGAGTADMETSGSLFYHGATVGLDVTW